MASNADYLEKLARMRKPVLADLKKRQSSEAKVMRMQANQQPFRSAGSAPPARRSNAAQSTVSPGLQRAT